MRQTGLILNGKAMISNPINAPPPDLKVVDINAVLPHEKSDIQRSQPLIERLKDAELYKNPPMVAAVAGGKYVLMDGSNRHISMMSLGFKHILVQVADYESEFVELGVWQHIVSDWDSRQLLDELQRIDLIEIRAGWDDSAMAQILLRDGPVYGIHAVADSLRERNKTLRQVVSTYHRNATLYRTPLVEPAQIWPLFPTGFALIMFTLYQPADIIEAALQGAYLPPGVSRHIIHGRALNLNYPMKHLREDCSLQVKNERLNAWLQRQYAERSVRFYAEATYQFDE